jgi:hypothetical protein
LHSALRILFVESEVAFHLVLHHIAYACAMSRLKSINAIEGQWAVLEQYLDGLIWMI